MIRFCLYFFLAATIISCSGNPSYTLSVQRSFVLNNLAGASGIALYDAATYIISDNMPGYQATVANDSIPIFYPFYPGAEAIQQDKNIKEDFENAAFFYFKNKQHIISFGSGSVESTRENILYFPVDTPANHTILPAGILYSSIKQQLGISTAQLNIEGSFGTKDSFYLLNRGTNHLIGMSIPALKALLGFTAPHAPQLNTRLYSLPVADSFPMAFSGACFYKDDRFLFTASVEKTTDWVADGAIAGSWIGMARLDGSILFLLPLKDAAGNMILQKLESIDIRKEYPNGDLALCAVADNDDGQSTLFDILLSKK